MINRLAAPAALPAGSGATEGQGRRCSPDHNSHISNQSPASKVCHFQLPEMCHFRLPLTWLIESIFGVRQKNMSKNYWLYLWEYLTLPS